MLFFSGSGVAVFPNKCLILVEAWDMGGIANDR